MHFIGAYLKNKKVIVYKSLTYDNVKNNFFVEVFWFLKYVPLKWIENHLGANFSNFGDPSLSTGANAKIDNAIIQLDKCRSEKWGPGF